MIGLIVVSAFVSCYIGLMRDPQPHRIPVAVTGARLAGQVQEALGDSVDVHRAASASAAHDALLHRDVVAVLRTGPHAEGLALDTAGANGLSTTAAVTRLVTGYAHGAGRHLTVTDTVPLDRYDARGLAGFYLSFGVTLAGFALAQSVVGLADLLHLRHRFTLMAAFAAASGLVAAAIAGPVLGAVPAPYLPLAFVLALLAAAAAFTTKMLATYFGPLGIPVATLLLLTVGNSTSGATIGTDLLPRGARTLSELMPPGAAVRAIGDISYFQGSHVLAPLATLVLWAAGSTILLALRTSGQTTPAPTRPQPAPVPHASDEDRSGPVMHASGDDRSVPDPHPYDEGRFAPAPYPYDEDRPAPVPHPYSYSYGEDRTVPDRGTAGTAVTVWSGGDAGRFTADPAPARHHA
ncbi:hypothetical protein [Streptomyces sp. NPDC048663]|uniref:hypothetical protein n=1 Tax=Streptomyces sp. NPDC048663 TaxID=3155638 RepID=UPI00342AAA61